MLQQSQQALTKTAVSGVDYGRPGLMHAPTAEQRKRRIPVQQQQSGAAAVCISKTDFAVSCCHSDNTPIQFAFLGNNLNVGVIPPAQQCQSGVCY